MLSKKLILVLGLVFFFLGGNLARAEVIINEIMYAPVSGDSEWVEIFNSGTDSVDLSDWRFFNNKDDSAPLRLQKGSAVLLGGEYALITSTSDWSSLSGTVFSSSQFSLPNESSKYNTYKAISDSNKQNINSVTYITSADTLGTGNSLQLISGEWKSETRTPGTANSTPTSGTVYTPTSTPVPESTTTPEVKTKIVETPKIKTQIIAKTLGFVGLPLFFNATTLGLNGEQLHFGKYFWNFGDGDSKEMQVNNSEQFTHTYFYPGDYIVSLDYYQNPYSSVSDASNQITIKIVPNDIFISKVGDEKDFFVELTNNTNYDADISNWILESSLKSFVFPKNTIIGSKKKIIFSPKITNLSVNDKNTLKLMTPQRETVSDYSASILVPVVVVPIETPSKNTVQQKTSTTPDQIKNSTAVKSIEENSATSALDEQIPVENLLSSVVESNVIKDNPVRIYFLTTILTVFLGLSAGSVYFIRQKRTVSKIGDDFKILDE